VICSFREIECARDGQVSFSQACYFQEADLWLAAISHSWQERNEVCLNWELRDSFAGRCCVADPFFAWRESFSLSEVVSAHTLPPVDSSEEKVVWDLSFSTL
jgi:hypothetical protein